MKQRSIRLNASQARWLYRQAKTQQISGAQYVRDLIEKQRRNRYFVECFKQTQETSFLQPALEHLQYLIMTAKLLEQLVLNEEDGAQKREVAYASTLETLKRLNIEPNRKQTYPSTLRLDAEQWAWVQEQAELLRKPPIAIVRKILEMDYATTNPKTTHVHTALTPAEQEGIKASLMAFALLKGYIESVYEDSQTLINQFEKEAQALYQKLYPSNTPL